MTTDLTRRRMLGRSLASLAGTAVAGCSSDVSAYDAILAEMARPLRSPTLQELVRFATLAANGHNTQPWKFRARTNSVDILPDFSRRTSVVDPDDHHLFASLGCAAENMSLAARARGLSGEALFVAEREGHVRIGLAPGASDETPLVAAIPARRCSRVDYDRKPVSADIMTRLARAATRYGVEPVFISDQKATERVTDLVIAGNSRQLDDPAFVAELKHWIRFNASAAAAARDGLYSASTGNPTAPSWLGSIMFDLFFSKQAENDKCAKQMRSASGVVVFVAASNDKPGWIAAGRAYQRFALQATVDGLKHAFVNQAVEVPEVRRELQALLGLGERRPNLIVRFGYGPTMPKSLRRSAADVILAAGA